MKSILDRTFRYVPSHSTDIRETFRRVKAEQEAAAALQRAGIPTIGKRATK